MSKHVCYDVELKFDKLWFDVILKLWNSHTMHGPPETPSPWQGSGGSAPEISWVLVIQKPKKIRLWG